MYASTTKFKIRALKQALLLIEWKIKVTWWVFSRVKRLRALFLWSRPLIESLSRQIQIHDLKFRNQILQKSSDHFLYFSNRKFYNRRGNPTLLLNTLKIWPKYLYSHFKNRHNSALLSWLDSNAINIILKT